MTTGSVTPEITCATCPHWTRKRASEAIHGICRRHPPTVFLGGSSRPLTDEADWCGEHPGRRVLFTGELKRTTELGSFTAEELAALQAAAKAPPGALTPIPVRKRR